MQALVLGWHRKIKFTSLSFQVHICIAEITLKNFQIEITLDLLILIFLYWSFSQVNFFPCHNLPQYSSVKSNLPSDSRLSPSSESFLLKLSSFFLNLHVGNRGIHSVKLWMLLLAVFLLFAFFFFNFFPSSCRLFIFSLALFSTLSSLYCHFH